MLLTYTRMMTNDCMQNSYTWLVNAFSKYKVWVWQVFQFGSSQQFIGDKIALHSQHDFLFLSFNLHRNNEIYSSQSLALMFPAAEI